MLPVPVTKTSARFAPDPRRVIAKPFLIGADLSPHDRARIHRIVARVVAMDEPIVVSTLAATLARFAGRHHAFESVLDESFRAVEHQIEPAGALSAERRRLIGAYFTHEYSIDAAALSNPSIVLAPSQEGVATGACRFVLSLRAIGEGHVSSIQFRSGTIDADGAVVVDPPSPFAGTARHRAPTYLQKVFRTKLTELQALTETARRILDALPDQFTLEQLESAIRAVEGGSSGDHGAPQSIRTMHWLATSNYRSTFEPTSNLSERVLFPAGPTESHGMEDARFVRFQYDYGAVTYFAPYTAYDGYRILPQLIETQDFTSFRIATLSGRCAVNKGVALFPRKLDGRFVALARLDNENSHLIRSDDVRVWEQSEILQAPAQPWELIQIGNSGSPLETEAGWLVITHGVGPMREYSLGAILLDLNDPARIIGRLTAPLLSPAADERDGYVPNVVYSCGSLIFDGMLVLPYGFSDVGARIATVRVDDLLTELTKT